MGGHQPKGVVAQDQTPRYFGMRDVNLGRRGFLAQEQLAERRRQIRFLRKPSSGLASGQKPYTFSGRSPWRHYRVRLMLVLKRPWSSTPARSLNSLVGVRQDKN